MTNDHSPRSPSPAGVDAALRAWRLRTDAAADASGRVTRIAAAVRSADLAPDETFTVARPPRRMERAGWFAAGVAAAVAAVVVGWRGGRQDESANWPPSVRFAAADIAARTALLAGMDEMFAGRIAWIAEHDDAVAVGTRADAAAVGAPVAVRVVVLARRAADAAWEPAWQADVVVRDEHVVDVAAGPEGVGRLRLWTHVLPDGAIAVDGALVLSTAGVPLQVSYSGVQHAGMPRRVCGDRAADVEWQVIQTVVPLDPAADAEVG